eukprot:CAMPEP_0184251946 /NCGR_PEP_ID=MMETSP0977-20130417/5656_1 /TAXON_ID=483370 /ORGANISM="non described non described, Strain CCMP2097" /LENGTH=45 /DNA_ID= /DNA_START= /DNA_END= /DNA_ORIENTATION=
MSLLGCALKQPRGGLVVDLDIMPLSITRRQLILSSRIALRGSELE